MQIKLNGCTRIVFLTEQYAIKVARIRPFRPLIRLLEILRKKESIRANLEKHDKKPVKGGIKYLLAGIRANRNEYYLYNKYKSSLLAPTLHMFAWGLVNIQVRGSSLEKSELHLAEKHPLWGRPTRKYEEFCSFGANCCLVDYGRQELEEHIALI